MLSACKQSLLCLLIICALAPHGHAAPADISTQFRGGPAHLGVFAGAPSNLFHQAWKFDTGNRVIASPIVADNTLFIGSKSGEMFALDARAGTLSWRFRADAPITSSAAVAHGVVYFQSDANSIFALSALDGHEIWRRTAGPSLPFHSIAILDFDVNWDFWTSSPLILADTIYIGGGDGHIYALDAKTGAINWQFATGGRVRATPASDGRRIYVGSFDGFMYALDAKSGRQAWKFKTDGNSDFPIGSIQSSAAIADGRVIFGSRDYELYALNATNGKLLWKNFHKGSWVISSPAIANGRVYVGSSDAHFVRSVDLKTGAEIWTRETDSNILSSPAIAGDFLYVGSFGGSIARIRLSDGALGGLQFDARIYASPWPTKDLLYFATDDGMVYAHAKGDLRK